MYDGLLIFPQLEFCINAPLQSYKIVDVHGLGKDASNRLPAPLHMVLDAYSAASCAEAKASPRFMSEVQSCKKVQDQDSIFAEKL